MRITRSAALSRLSVKPLAARLAVACSLLAGAPYVDCAAASRPAFVDATGASVAPRRPAATLPVTNCNDDGNGSLRAVVGSAADGDTVDLDGLACSTITLQSGAIVVSVNNLTIQGPGSVTIDGQYNDSLFEHTGSGTLSLVELNLTRGRKYQNGQANALGGCVFSAGNVTLEASYMTHCIANHGGQQAGYYARGGAIYAEGNVRLVESAITDSAAVVGSPAMSAPGGAAGGGIYAIGYITLTFSAVSANYATISAQGSQAIGGGLATTYGITMKYSTIADNMAVLGTSNGVYFVDSTAGGAAILSGDVDIKGSTISGNSAETVGGLSVGGGGSSPVSITNSTISGNYGYAGFGGVLVDRSITLSHAVAISNSTIAFNTAHGSRGGAGVVLESGASLDLESTILARNVSSGDYAADLDVENPLVVTGANNLVQAIGVNVTLPGGTLNADPLLGPLQNNGGRTATLALLPGSPAIDAGNNAAGLSTDERYAGFARVVGLAADIGAYEWDPDLIFASGFD